MNAKIKTHSKKRTLQRLRRRLIYWAARVIQGLLFLLPFDTAITVGSWLGRLAFVALPAERRKTLQNLALAFGNEKSTGEIRSIARAVFANAGRALAEIMLLPRWTDERLRRRIHCDEAAREMIARSARGLVIMTAHFGNWELLGVYGARILGLNLGVIARGLSNPYLNRMINHYRRGKGVKVFIRGESAIGYFRHLMRGGVLAMLADQDIRKVEGTFVEFFGRPARTPTGPAELIVRSGAAWAVCVLERQSDGRSHRLRWDGPFSIPNGHDHATKVRLLTEQYTRKIEEIVRRNPDQWMWMHNRWQSSAK